MSLKKGDQLYRRAFLNGLTPDPVFTVSEWADQYRWLSQKSSAEPGRWRTDRTPYLREIMDCLSARSAIQTVVFMKGAQIGGTECGNNWLGYIMDYNPGPTMAVQPGLDLAKRFSRQRIDTLISETPRVRAKVSAAKSRDSKNTILSKDFEGGVLIITGANSAAGLRSMPARNLFLDEIDAYPLDVDREGDPVSLVEARTRTFYSRKVLKVSTPTIEGKSRIKSAYENSDQRQYFVPCPHCEEKQTIQWKSIKWPKGQPHLATLICEFCGAEIEEYHKTHMLEKGEWRSQNPTHQNRKVVGFHLNSLYSPLGWFSWGDAASIFEEAHREKDETKLRSFVNTVLAETWNQKGDAPEWQRLYERRESYEFNKVPEGALFVTAGVDVQKDRFEVEIVAWGRDKQSWSMDYRVYKGDTATAEPYKQLDELLNETFPVAGNEKIRLRIETLAIDSGFNTQAVYNWARRFPGNRVIATKGSEKAKAIIGLPTVVDLNYKGDRVRRGVRMFMIGVDIAKGELYGWLNLPKPTSIDEKFPSGYCHFPEYDDAFFKMLTAEQIVSRIVRGFRKYEWEKTRERNEALDCRVMARAAASLFGLDRFKPEKWAELEAELAKKPEIDSKNSQANSKNEQIPRKPSSFW